MKARAGRLLRWVRGLSSDPRFHEAVVAYEKEFAGRRRSAKCVVAVKELIREARDQAAVPDFNAAWACLLAAMRREILDYRPQEVRDARVALRLEAVDKLSGWRAQAIAELLQGPEEHLSTLLQGLVADKAAANAMAGHLAMIDEEEARAREIVQRLLEAAKRKSATLTPELLVAIGTKQMVDDRLTLWLATYIRDEDSRNRYRRIRIVRDQLTIIGALLVLALVALVLLVVLRPVSLGQMPDAVGGRIWAWVMVFGALGGAVSAAQSIASRPPGSRIPEQIQHGLTTAVRPLFGAAGATAGYVLLSTTVNNMGGVLGLAFAAGFSERIVVQAVGSVSQARGQPA